MLSDQRRIQHLYWRAGFGLHLREIQKLRNKSIGKLVKNIFSDSTNYHPIELVDWKLAIRMFSPGTPMDEKAAYKKIDRQQMDDFRSEWVRRMAEENYFLREKMTLFWHDHFACSANRTPQVEIQNNLLRKHALGSFRTMVKEIAVDPLMLQYLNGQGNKKSQPNENFARELLELFTLGIGNYTEKDIKEAARAFTGWRFNKEDYSVNRKDGWHDFGSKTFMGNTGKFDGNDIIDIILTDKQCSRFISKKVYRYFVNEKPNKGHIEEMANVFYSSNYDISALMEHVFTSDWFYSDQNIGSKIKTPTEFVAGMMKQLDLKFHTGKMLTSSLKLMGQKLFKPPNVAGWPKGRKWINTSSLLFRMDFPNSIMSTTEREQLVYKDEIDPETGEVMRIPVGRKTKKIKDIAAADWRCVAEELDWKGDEELLSQLNQYLLQRDLVPASKKVILNDSYSGSKQDQVANMTLRIMATPEYQLC